MSKEKFRKQAAALSLKIRGLIDHGSLLEVIKAPPGSGKTTLMADVLNHAYGKKMRIAVATQTNSQADYLCTLLATEYPSVKVIRFVGGGSLPPPLPASVDIESKWKELPSSGRCVVVGTSSKWGTANAASTFDILFVEEAWQLAWCDFMLLQQVAERFLLIGDPGQIPPVVTIDTSRWETANIPPHFPAPEVILQTRGGELDKHQLPATWRLPSDAVDLVRQFYDFDFGSANSPGDRLLKPVAKVADAGVRGLFDHLERGAVAAYTLQTPSEGPPLEKDKEIAAATVRLTEELISSRAVCHFDGKDMPLTESDIGIIATHRVMVSEISLGLPAKLRGVVSVDTPERWQGLQKKMIIFVHPLSGTTRPSGFDLETGRLCVMASRHQVGLVVVGRDHIAETLDGIYTSAEQAPGRPDSVGRGRSRHSMFWGELVRRGRVIRAA